MTRKRGIQRRKYLIVEYPLGVIAGLIEEPGEGFVDAEGEADKEACQWERSKKEAGRIL